MSAPLVTRRNALKALGATAGAATLLPWLSDEGLAAFAEAQKANAAPVLKVLTPAQYVTVEHLVEAIIPTDARSPGAKDARVADYMDLLLAEADEGLRKDWLAGLAALDAESSKRFGRGFAKLDPAQTDALLSDISKYETAKSVADPALQVPRNEEPKPLPPQVDTLLGEVGRHRGSRKSQLETFFANTKQATNHGYYTSEIGIHKELRYKGNKVLLEFVGCQTVDGKDCPYCGQKAEA
ncbi:MAG TPA: gluconate 2-dehydrogenase subunit 3 family protein [Vicinamibacteria bacterium]|nr:gluconate 2-dehydrogenase subunit 3 family protein [Vicinamibacteria bacterium]